MVLLDERKSLLLGKQTPEPSKASESKRAAFRGWIVPAIVFVQVSMCVLAWTFVGVMIHGTIALPDSQAAWVQNNPSDVQAIVTLLSTVFALVSSSLLGKTVQCALVHRLSAGPLGLDTMVEWARLAQRAISLKFDRRHLSWTFLSIVWISLLSLLTTAWSTLLAPESVMIYYALQGTELNLLDPSLSLVLSVGDLAPPPGYTLTPFDADMLMNGFSGLDLTIALMNAGFSLASAVYTPNTNFVNIPGTPYAGNTSTGGVYPSGVLSFPPNAASTIGNPSYQGFGRTYTVTQHGFTANVSCRTPTANDPAIVLNLTSSVEITAGGYDAWALDTYAWSTTCSSQVTYATYGVTVVGGLSPGGQNQLPGENGLLMTSVCFGQGLTGPSNQSFLVLLDAPTNSSYHPLRQVCEVTPLVTTVQTTYDGSGIVHVLQPPLSQYTLPNPTSTNDTGILMWFPALMIWGVCVRSQGTTANTIGDSLYGFMHAESTFVVALYLRGMMEYLGSLVVALAPFPNATDGEGTVPFNGTVSAQTYGWTFHPRTHGPSLVAITLVTMLTVVSGAYVIVPVGVHEGKRRTRWGWGWRVASVEDRGFNPTATTDVLRASSAGDLARALSESDESHDGALRVVLGRTAEGAPALRTVGGGWGRVGGGDSEIASRDECVELEDLRAATARFD